MLGRGPKICVNSAANMWREPMLNAQQLKYECSLSEGTTPTKCEAMVVEDGAEALLDVEETC